MLNEIWKWAIVTIMTFSFITSEQLIIDVFKEAFSCLGLKLEQWAKNESPKEVISNPAGPGKIGYSSKGKYNHTSAFGVQISILIHSFLFWVLKSNNWFYQFSNTTHSKILTCISIAISVKVTRMVIFYGSVQPLFMPLRMYLKYFTPLGFLSACCYEFRQST